MSRRQSIAVLAAALTAGLALATNASAAAGPALTLTPDTSSEALIFDTTMSGTLPACAGRDMIGGTDEGPYVPLVLGAADADGAFAFRYDASGMLGSFFQNPSPVFVPPGSYPMSIWCNDDVGDRHGSPSVLFTVVPPQSVPSDQSAPARTGALRLPETRIVRGGTTTIHADGPFWWDPISAASYSVVLYPTSGQPVVLGQGWAGDDGTVSTDVRVPADAPPGPATVVLFANSNYLLDQPQSTGGGAGSGGSLGVRNDGLEVLTADVVITCGAGTVSTVVEGVSQEARPVNGTAADLVDEVNCKAIVPLERQAGL